MIISIYILIFILALIGIIFSSTELAKYSDLLSKKKPHISSTFIGSLIIAATTSLPELFSTTVSASIQNVDMALSNIFGSNITNLFFIALLDFLTKYSLLKVAPIQGWDKEKILSAFFIVFNTINLIFWLFLFHFFKLENYPFLYAVPILSNLFFYFYAYFSIFYLSKNGKNDEEKENLTIAEKKEEVELSSKPILLTQIYNRIILSGIAIFVISIILAYSGDKISQIKIGHIAIGGSFIGFVFLSLSTSLPEFISCYHCIKLGNNKMALGTLYGSNLFNLAIYSFAEITFILSQVYSGHPKILKNILIQANPIQIIIGIISLIMLVISFIASLKKKSYFSPNRFSLSSIFLALIYFLCIFLIYQSR